MPETTMEARIELVLLNSFRTAGTPGANIEEAKGLR
jgi:hypothetical protein